MTYESRKLSAELRAEGAKAYLDAVKSGFAPSMRAMSGFVSPHVLGRAMEQSFAASAATRGQGLPYYGLAYPSGLPDQMRAYLGVRRA